METIKIAFNYSDIDYRTALNFEYMFYNFPVTVTINQDKYILGVGSSDRLYHLVENNLVYIIGENTGLDYISCVVINTEEKQVIQDIFLNSISDDPGNIEYDIFNLDIEDQINILSNWFQ